MSDKLTRNDFLATVRPEDLDGHLREVAEHCGVDVAVRLWGPFQGSTLSIPKQALKKAAIRYIREHYDGNNMVDLVRATGFAERFVYEAVSTGTIKHDQYTLPGCEER